MSIGFSIFSLYLAPLIAVIAWLICLIHLRSWLLIGMTIFVIVLIMLTSSNAVFAVTLNPYLLLILLALGLFNTLVLPTMEAITRPYLIQANFVLLLMIAGLHLWAVYLRQSDLYFYEQSNYWATTLPLLLTTLSLAIPISASVIRLNPDNGRFWSMIMIVGLIVASLGLGLIFV